MDLDLQRSINRGSYQTIKSYPLNSIIGFEPFDFMDADLPSGTIVTYRLMAKAIVGYNQFSPVIKFHLQGSRPFGIYPVPFVSTATVNLYSTVKGTGVLRLAGFSGRIVWQEEVNLDKGNNSFALQRPNGLPDGNYVAVLRVGEKAYTQKLALTSH